MTEKVIDDWKFNADGEDVNSILIISFENFSPDDMKDISITKLSNNKLVSYADKDIRETEGVMTRWFYIPESNKAFDIDFAHPKYGSTRIPGVTMQKHKIYHATLRAHGTVSVAITSIPAGTKVFFDQHEVGVTPITIPEVVLGKHHIKLDPQNYSISQGADMMLDVTLTNTTFDFDLMRKKAITFIAEPANAKLQVTKDGQILGENVGKISDLKLDYGTYIVKGFIGSDDNETPVVINDDTPTPYTIKVVPSRMISFMATQNNQPAYDVDINLDGLYIGTTPLDYKVDYGKHTVDMTLSGYSKSQTFYVSRNSDSYVNLRLPNRHQYRHNLFDIYYKRREWGIAANYINRTYTFKQKGERPSNYNFYLNDGRENGVQLGVTYQGYYGYGQGINTGIYWQMFWGDALSDSSDNPWYMENAIYVPIQYQFRLPLHKNFSIFANAGIGMSLGVENKLHFSGDGGDYSLGYGYNEDYDMIFPKRFDCSLLFGGGIQFKALQIEAKYSSGLINQNQILEYNGITEGTMKSSSWQVGLSLLF
ncbi:MAG: PEGA domain-containing protein [Muribaculaceae bacterium]|nr:PEGA domain-containing protein [Muribaculaceae bacterium]